MTAFEQKLRAKFPNAPESFFRRQLADALAARTTQVLAGKRLRQDAKPLMNGLETDFLSYLESAYAGFRIVPQGMRVKIATGAWFKVDFFIPAKLAAYEVKGPKVMYNQQSRQLLALKVAAAQWPEITWWLAWKENRVWQKQQVLS